jgi:hypothetical protein
MSCFHSRFTSGFTPRFSPRLNPRSSLALSIAFAAACSSPEETPPDAAPPPPPSMIPSSATGRFALTSELTLAVPAEAEPVLATLTAATDGPDDPTRYLVDHMIATLPDGTMKTIALGAAPYVAAYLNARLADVMPRFAPGIAALVDGLSRIATHLGTTETLRVDGVGNAVRTITGVRFTVGATPINVRFADHGLPDVPVDTRATLDAAGHLTLTGHHHALPYGALLRLGLDHAVVPSVEPTARDLPEALAALVDCDAIGAAVADRLGIGAPALYRAACRTAMTAIASEIDTRIAAIEDVTLTVAGGADAIDLDGDGVMDELRNGGWTAAGAVTAFRAGSFAASEAP